MAKVKFRFNPDTLTYEKVIYSGKQKLKLFLHYFLIIIGISLFINILIFLYGKTPEFFLLEKENLYLSSKLSHLSVNINEVKNQLVQIQQRDDNLYRPIFEIEPISSSIRKAGFGGVYRYKNLEGYNNSELLIDISQNVDELIKQIYIQSKSYDQVIEKALEKELFLKSRPSIKPLSDNDYIRISDYFGWRKDPFTGKPSKHYGIDFAGPKGGNIVTTGDGIVTKARYTLFGYGRVVEIDHGFGYKTKYAHLHKIYVKEGQKVSRGEAIGLLGNTGRSTGSHLHYEVMINNTPVNPIYFFNDDISPEEYNKMLQYYSKN
ncbi:MAG: M23 family metallopeptidase [Bacteroidales bacterium]|nr:M23 family metallopeptidase [Bacteroidales bacterium]